MGRMENVLKIFDDSTLNSVNYTKTPGIVYLNQVFCSKHICGMHRQKSNRHLYCECAIVTSCFLLVLTYKFSIKKKATTISDCSESALVTRKFPAHQESGSLVVSLCIFQTLECTLTDVCVLNQKGTILLL